MVEMAYSIQNHIATNNKLAKKRHGGRYIKIKKTQDIVQGHLYACGEVTTIVYQPEA